MKNQISQTRSNKQSDMLEYCEIFQPEIKNKIKKSYKRTKLFQIAFCISLAITIAAWVMFAKIQHDSDALSQFAMLGLFLFEMLLSILTLIFGFLNRGNPWFTYQKWYKNPASINALRYKLQVWDDEDRYVKLDEEIDNRTKNEMISCGYSMDDIESVLGSTDYFDEKTYDIDVNIDNMM